MCSFEIKLDEIAGLDYWNPLLVDASRVVHLRLGMAGDWDENSGLLLPTEK